MRAVLGFILFGLGGAAAAQTAPAPVAFGDTAMVAEPCPPMPAPLAEYLAAPKGAPSAEVLKAYAAFGDYERANDWPGLCRYRSENQKALADPRPEVVFMGDSITELWRRYDPGFFTHGRVDRGISGQTTPQMVVRFQQDVIALHPRVVHIMAGTNDVAGNTGPTSEDAFKNNIAAMVDMARANHIAVVLASIPPAEAFSWRPALKPAARIGALNRWLANYARERGATFVDYTAALANSSGGMRSDLSADGVHPNKAGYDLIEPLALKSIAEAEAARSKSRR